MGLVEIFSCIVLNSSTIPLLLLIYAYFWLLLNNHDNLEFSKNVVKITVVKHWSL
jgi:hypothetical protein